jgi:hypothetical protein
VPTRRYHGYLIAALPAPLGRVVMLNHLSERLPFFAGETRVLESEVTTISGELMERQLPRTGAANFLTYHLLAGPRDVQLEVRPAVHFRPHETPVSGKIAHAYTLSITAGQFRILGGAELPLLRMFVEADRHYFVWDDVLQQVSYQAEADRGYDSAGSLWSPGFFGMILNPGRKVSLIASTESWRKVAAIRPAEAFAAEHARRA